jgi:DNA-binding NarL/FixJ family response regulator
VTEERRCLIIDEHPTFRLGVRGLLESRYEVEEAEDGRAALALATVEDFDVAIVEMKPGANGGALSGMAAIKALLDARPGLGIVAHAQRPERHAAAQAMSAGANAYVAKSSPAGALAEAVEAAASAERFVDPAARAGGNEVSLTRRQREILQLFADGHSTADVARRLGLSGETVRTHTKAVLARLDAHDRAHAVAIGLRNSLID